MKSKSLINEKVKSGAYESADEVIMESLRLLQAKEEGMEALRRENHARRRIHPTRTIHNSDY